MVSAQSANRTIPGPTDVPVRFSVRRAAGSLHRTWVRWRRLLICAAVCLGIAATVTSEAYLGPAARELTARRALNGAAFDFAGWEIAALAGKARDAVLRPGAGLSEAEQVALVRSYFAAIDRIAELKAAIKRTYADPQLGDHAAAAAPLEAELADLRDEQARRRPAVERILERQVASLLADEGLAGIAGILPPVRFDFTESPKLLVVSPRDRIATELTEHIDPALPVSDAEQIEGQVERKLDVSALVEDTGGISTYPTMVIEERSLEWVLSTIAHEWAHTYLFFRPLGQAYLKSGDTRTLNETTASIIGDELARRIMLRYYPDLVGPAPWPRPLADRPRWWEQTPEDRPFEFGPFMRETRLTVDRILEEGRIEEAEAYMEARRQKLVEQGYNIRRLNQAYFAFHGSYAVGPAATDPIGAKLRALRQRSDSLAQFVRTVSRITSLSALDAALQASPDGIPAGGR